MERYYYQSGRDSKSNQTVFLKIINGQRKRRSMYQNDLWLRFIRNLILFWTISSFYTVLNMKTFCDYKLMKEIKKSKQPLTTKFEQMEIICFPVLYFLFFWRKIHSAHHKMVSHCMIMQFIILITVITNKIQFSQTTIKFQVYARFSGPHVI